MEQETIKGFHTPSLYDWLRKSQQLVYRVGPGLDLSTASAKYSALNYLRLLAGCAIRHPVHFFDCSSPQSPSHKQWGSLLTTLFYPIDNAKVYLPRNPKAHSQACQSLHLVDPHSQAITEIAASHLASAQTLVRSAAIASALQARLTAQIDQGEWVAATPQALRTHFGLTEQPRGPATNTCLYFAYGSNMHMQQMLDRMRSTEKLGIASLPGYRLCFDIPGAIWSAAVANIAPADAEVWGVVYRVDKDELIQRMDFYEGVFAGEYQRTELDIVFEQQPCKAYVYTNPNADGVKRKPSQVYLARIIDGAKSNKLPNHYIQSMYSHGSEQGI